MVQRRHHLVQLVPFAGQRRQLGFDDLDLDGLVGMGGLVVEMERERPLRLRGEPQQELHQGHVGVRLCVGHGRDLAPAQPHHAPVSLVLQPELACLRRGRQQS
jgi:hypothetical protein